MVYMMNEKSQNKNIIIIKATPKHYFLPVNIMMQTQEDDSVVINVIADELTDIKSIVQLISRMLNEMSYNMDDSVLVQHTPVVDKFSMKNDDLFD